MYKSIVESESLFYIDKEDVLDKEDIFISSICMDSLAALFRNNKSMTS